MCSPVHVCISELTELSSMEHKTILSERLATGSHASSFLLGNSNKVFVSCSQVRRETGKQKAQGRD
jgi:hypothetical protein